VSSLRSSDPVGFEEIGFEEKEAMEHAVQGRAARAGRVVASLACALAVIAAADEGLAAGAIAFETWDGGLLSADVHPGDSAARTGAGGQASSMAGNPALNHSAWAHTGAWWSLHLEASSSVTIAVHAHDAGELSPGVAVWASGGAAFDGGTTGWLAEVSTAGWGTPHSFNAFGPLGDPGTLWMQTGQGGNMQELLGYAVSGPSVLDPTGWGETIANGAHDLSLGPTYVDSVSGSVGSGFVELVLTGVETGWYTIYAGGTDHAQSGGLFDLSVTSLPEPSTALLLSVGLLAACGRRFF
jgi:hypothetical protein